MSNLAYREWRRMHGRTVEQYKQDIKQAHKDERIVIEKYAEYCKKNYGLDLVIEDNGCDNSGEFLNIDEVTSDADFIVNGKLVEVKVVRYKLTNFRLKVDSLKSYIKQKAYMLLVVGWKTDNPEFTLLKPKKMIELLKTKKVYTDRDWENKKVVKVSYNDFDWDTF
jgi:hypothetical protein